MEKNDRYGNRRVIEPKGVLPQQAWKIDNTMRVYDNEILIDVRKLNIDSASFMQIKKEAGNDIERIKKRILDIVEERGKLHNPATGSGGMLIGTIENVGESLKKHDLKIGDKIATLVSLSLTPLRLDKIKEIKLQTGQVLVEGKAILFESGIYAKLPNDLDETLVMAALDVAGAPAQTAKWVNSGDTVFIIGAGGKSGLLCLYEAKKRAGVTGRVVALAHSSNSCDMIKELGLADFVLHGDATRPLEVLEMLLKANNGKLADIVINTVNVPNTEMASILTVKDGGVIYFFSMATSFTRAALGAEGIGRDVDMIIGNGYTKGHAAITLEILRENKKLREIFSKKYI
ncbi:MAG: zinc-binding alcohol dehydrogenase family protein [Spirochaetes bacterium]|nr:zinc-binding alcohol dehydrogenase family protein [Spirochaetota bacterium]